MRRVTGARPIVTAEGCHQWPGSLTQGYGQFNGLRMHRVVALMVFGYVPIGMEVCHTCDNRCCINPAHLWIGTHYENMQDMKTKGRKKATECKVHGPGASRNRWGRCNACNNERNRRYRAEKKARGDART